MKVAILSESAADEAVLRILVEGVLGRETEHVPTQSLRTRGWPSVREVIPPVLKHLYYHIEAEAFVVVADSNHSPVHVEQAEKTGRCHPLCRLCLLRESIHQVQSNLSLRPDRPRLKTAIGLAVPIIEAWYHCGRDPQVSEAAWISGLQDKSDPYTKNGLKQAVYGTDRQSLELGKRRGIEEATRLVKKLAALEKRFPIGFGSLARDVRAWRDA